MLLRSVRCFYRAVLHLRVFGVIFFTSIIVHNKLTTKQRLTNIFFCIISMGENQKKETERGRERQRHQQKHWQQHQTTILMWQNIFVTNLRQSTKLDYLQKFCGEKSALAVGVFAIVVVFSLRFATSHKLSVNWIFFSPTDLIALREMLSI